MSGKGSSMWLKALALISAVALGGGYVAWKGVEAGKTKELEQEERAEVFEEMDEVPLIVGSKSPGGRAITREEIQVILDERLLPDLPTQPEKREALMSSSKSGLIRLPKGDEPIKVLPGSKSFLISPPATNHEAPVEKPVRVLPGSKSINFILDNPGRPKVEQEP